MVFTTWNDLRTAIKDAIADHMAGSPGSSCTGEYSIAGRSLKYRTHDELIRLYEKTWVLEGMESPGTVGMRSSYGRCRRFI